MTNLDRLPAVIELTFGGKFRTATQCPHAQCRTYVATITHAGTGQSINLRVGGLALLRRFAEGRARIPVGDA